MYVDGDAWHPYKEVPYKEFVENYYEPLLKEVDALLAEGCTSCKKLQDMYYKVFRMWHNNFAESIAWSDFSSMIRMQHSFPELTCEGSQFGILGATYEHYEPVVE